HPIVVLDPPRAGCSEKLLHSVALMRPKIIYVSCHPATCARDVNLLTSRGYTIRKIVPVDMFPQTSHIEIAVLLEP
ncbi:MAG: 23S rRNA (uracil-5-)-methyltransferase RumA, partial [bacterium]